jgi:hypothetical protein
MTQNGPGTAPGSQGVFGAKGVGCDMGARQLFGAGVVLSSCQDKCSVFIRRREFNQIRFEF